MPHPVRRIALAAAAVALTSVLAACSGDSSMPGLDHGSGGMSTSTTGTLTTGSGTVAGGRDGDIMFAQMMIPHHQQAVEMADLALGSSSASTQVKDLATAIKKAQDPEIATMRQWLSAWAVPTAPSTGMDHGGTSGTGMMTEADMQALKNATGPTFDEKWVAMMIAHHEGAVAMANTVLSTTQDPQVKVLAEAVVQTQTAEIATMKALP